MLDQLQLIIDVLDPVTHWIIALVAVVGIFNTRWIWKQTNRPIISALVETESIGNMMSTFNLTVVNSGNRPATNIRLTIDDYEEFKKCLAKKVEDPLINSINRCFSEDGTIPLLINGEKRTNSFGLISENKEHNTWNYGSSFNISIAYKDLKQKKYKSNLALFIKHTDAFAAGSWSRDSNNRILNLLQQLIEEVNISKQ